MSYVPWSGRPHHLAVREIEISVDRPYRLMEGGALIGHHGLWLWCSAVALARVLAKKDLAGKRVIEFGAGVGLPGIVAAANGAHVTFCDSRTTDRLTENLKLNGVHGTITDGKWGDTKGSWDLGIAADALTYDRDLMATVAATCDNFLIVDALQFDLSFPRGTLAVPERGYHCHCWVNNIADMPVPD